MNFEHKPAVDEINLVRFDDIDYPQYFVKDTGKIDLKADLLAWLDASHGVTISFDRIGYTEALVDGYTLCTLGFKNRDDAEAFMEEWS